MDDYLPRPSFPARSNGASNNLEISRLDRHIGEIHNIMMTHRIIYEQEAKECIRLLHLCADELDVMLDNKKSSITVRHKVDEINDLIAHYNTKLDDEYFIIPNMDINEKTMRIHRDGTFSNSKSEKNATHYPLGTGPNLVYEEEIIVPKRRSKTKKSPVRSQRKSPRRKSKTRA